MLINSQNNDNNLSKQQSLILQEKEKNHQIKINSKESKKLNKEVKENGSKKFIVNKTKFFCIKDNNSHINTDCSKINKISENKGRVEMLKNEIEINSENKDISQDVDNGVIEENEDLNINSDS